MRSRPTTIINSVLGKVSELTNRKILYCLINIKSDGEIEANNNNNSVCKVRSVSLPPGAGG